jgi:hypothetical protein
MDAEWSNNFYQYARFIPLAAAPIIFADKYDPAAHNDRMSNLRQTDLRRRGLLLTTDN